MRSSVVNRTPRALAATVRTVVRTTRRTASLVRDFLRREWWRRPALAVLFLLFAYVTADRVLPVHPAPQERPPKIAALPPANGSHDGRSGYVISVELEADSCSEPVRGSVTVVLPREFFEAEDEFWVAPPPRKALFGAAFSSTDVEVTQIAPYERRLGQEPGKSWAWSFSDPLRADADGTVAAARFDNWRKRPDQLDVMFTAPWLQPRGYGSCWLATPELVGDLQTFAVNAADAINYELGESSGADHLSTGSSVSYVFENQYPDGSTRRHKSKKPFTWDYVDFATPPSVGFVSLETPMSVLPTESQGPSATVGVPTWSCRDTRTDSLSRSTLYGLGQDGGFRWSDGARLSEYTPPGSDSRCDSWVALIEPDVESKRDLWLIVIGAAFSAGLALLVDALVLRPGRRRKRIES